MLLQNQQGEPIGDNGSSSKKTLIGIALILASILVYVFGLKGISATVSAFESDFADKTSQIEKVKTEVNNLANSESQLDVTTEVQREQSLKAIPSKLNQDEVIRNLVDLASSHTIELHSLSFAKGGSDADGVSSLRIDSSFEGNYGDLVTFLKGIEQNARFLRVNSISAQINKSEVFDIDRVTFSLSMEAFFQK